MRVFGADTLAWWKQRFQELGATHSDVVERDGRLTRDFEDFEGQRLSLIDDGGQGSRPNRGSTATCRPSTRSAASARSC